MHVALLLFFLILTGNARWLTEEGKALLSKRSGRDPPLEQTEETELPKVTDDGSQTPIASTESGKVTDAESHTPEFETTPRRLETDSPSIKSDTEVKTDNPSSVESSGKARSGTEKTIPVSIHSSTPSGSSTSSTGKPTEKADEGEGLWTKMKKGAASIYETAKGGLANLTDRFSKWLKKRSNDSKEAAGESTTPVANVRRKKSVGDDDVGDEHHEITLDFKRINDDDGEQQSKVRLAREARMIGFPSSPQLQTKGATSPKIPARPTPTQVTFDRPSVKLHGNDSPSVKLPEEVSSLPTNEDGDSGTGDMASEKTHPKTDYYRRRDPLTKKEYSVDKPIARDESGRPYRNRKHPRRKSHRKLSRRKFHRKEDPSTDTEEDDLEGGPLWGRNEFIVR